VLVLQERYVFLPLEPACWPDTDAIGGITVLRYMLLSKPLGGLGRRIRAPS
jgi:hypothetical protein